MAEKKGWTSGLDISKGGLHRSLHIPAGQKIPAARLAEAKRSSNPRIRKQATLAETFKHMRSK